MPLPEELADLAPAKINLVLEVLGRRADGYHEIDTVLQTLDLADRVAIHAEGQPGIDLHGPFARGVPADETNLAWRAASELAARCGESVDGLSIEIEKYVPPASGLGGGASDAATVLRLLQQWWPAATESHVREAAAAVGSDETYFLVGGTARARGRGERVDPLPELPRRGVVLFLPWKTLERKTGRMFEALGRLPFDRGGVAEAFSASPPLDFMGADVFNAFERVAFDQFEGLAGLWQDLERAIGEPVHLAGAGPTLFWLGDPSEARSVAARTSSVDCLVIPTFTTPSLWRR